MIHPRFRFHALAAAGLAALCLIAVSMLAQTPAVQTTPPWAYALNPPPTPGAQPAPDDGRPKTPPGSSVSPMLPQTRDLFSPPGWYPDDHPKMAKW